MLCGENVSFFAAEETAAAGRHGWLLRGKVKKHKDFAQRVYYLSLVPELFFPFFYYYKAIVESHGLKNIYKDVSFPL